jgi:hypothetical protein
MKSHASGSKEAEKKPGGRSGIGQVPAAAGREAAGAISALNAGALSPGHVMQLQQTIGNRATGAVIQRMIDPSTGNKFPVDWRNMSYYNLLVMKQHIEQGTLIPEAGELEAMNSRLAQLMTGPTGRVEEQGNEAENDEIEIEEDNGYDNSSSEEEGSSSEDEEDGMTLEEFYVTDWSAPEMEAKETEDEDYEMETNPIVKDIYDTMEPTFKASVDGRDGRKLPGKKVQGDFLEHYFTTHARDTDQGERDANQFAMNIPGIDHMVDNGKHPFVQDKMHLSVHTAKIETYRAHYANRYKMAQNLLKGMAEEGKRGTNIRAMFESVVSDDAWIHKDAVQSILNAVNKHREEYSKALESSKANSLPDITDDDALIRQVGDYISFAVPSDIWEQMYLAKESGIVSDAELSAYIRLDVATSEFQQLYGMLSHVAAPWNEKKPKEEDDEYRG